MIPFLPGADGHRMSIDAVNAYAPLIESGEITNWHSALFLIECRFFLLIVDCVFGSKLAGLEVLYIVWWIAFVLIVLSLMLIAWRLSRNNIIWVYLLPFISPLCAYLGTAMGWSGYYGLDFYWCSLMLFAIALLVSYVKCSSRLAKTILLFTMLIVFLHMLSFRRNSIFVVIFLGSYLMGVFSYRRINRTIAVFLKSGWRSVISTAAVFLLYFVSNTFVDSVFNVERMRPLYPMMESDMRICAILNGEQATRQYKQSKQVLADNICSSCVMRDYSMMGANDITWSKYQEEYVSMWKEKPFSMAASLIIQRIQFYCSGQNYSWLTSSVEYLFPAVKNNRDAWRYSGYLARRPLGRLALLFAPFILLLLVKIVKKLCLSDVENAVITVTCWSSILYSLSYLLVSPMVHPRYLAPSCMLSIYACVMFAFMLVIRGVKRIGSLYGSGEKL